MFLSCGKTSSLHFPSILGLSVSSISRAAFSRHIRQIATTFPLIIRVCRLLGAHEARVAIVGNTTITVDDDFSQDEMMRGLVQQAVQQALKTEVQKLDEELGNDYKAC